MQVEKNEVLFIYNSENHKEKEALAYVKSLAHYRAKELDVNQESISPTQLKDIAKHCGYKLTRLLNERHPKYMHTEIKNLGEADLLTLLSKKPFLLHTPFILWHDGGKHLSNKYEIVSEDLELNKKRIKTKHENAY
jgi:arsenate reductase-like glutaredoxin family protein